MMIIISWGTVGALAEYQDSRVACRAVIGEAGSPRGRYTREVSESQETGPSWTELWWRVGLGFESQRKSKWSGGTGMGKYTVGGTEGELTTGLLTYCHVKGFSGQSQIG
ncbi:hypothetical protein V6N13_015502 [Hibiscus sabdariffa]|uniref:Secreted protein n=1 Tax=Hibiscus sabdariffa TaxID=183260 RepID=A0ABR2CVU8_9ROSI